MFYERASCKQDYKVCKRHYVLPCPNLQTQPSVCFKKRFCNHYATFVVTRKLEPKSQRTKHNILPKKDGNFCIQKEVQTVQKSSTTSRVQLLQHNSLQISLPNSGHSPCFVSHIFMVVFHHHYLWKNRSHMHFLQKSQQSLLPLCRYSSNF